MRQAVVFGAGKIGRGFLGQLFCQSGYAITFVEAVPRLVEELNRRGAYTIHIAADPPSRFRVSGLRAVPAAHVDAVARALLGADIAATAVGVPNLRHVGPLLAEGLKRRVESERGPLDVVVCENLLDAPEVLRRETLSHLPPGMREAADAVLGCVGAVVSRMVPDIPPGLADPIYTSVEPYCILPVDATAFKAGIPPVQGFQPCDKIHALEERKLFTHNCGHAVAAYLGALAGYRYIWEAMADRDIYTRTRGAMEESGRALVPRHGFRPGEYEAHVDDLLARFANRGLGDTVARVGRDVLRKLGPRDRLVGAARLCEEHGVVPRHIAAGIAAALLYREPSDPSASRMAQYIAEMGVEGFLRSHCGIDAKEPLGELVLTHYERFRAARGSS